MSMYLVTLVLNFAVNLRDLDVYMSIELIRVSNWAFPI